MLITASGMSKENVEKQEKERRRKGKRKNKEEEEEVRNKGRKRSVTQSGLENKTLSLTISKQSSLQHMKGQCFKWH